jgi:hypothetical protein
MVIGLRDVQNGSRVRAVNRQIFFVPGKRLSREKKPPSCPGGFVSMRCGLDYAARPEGRRRFAFTSATVSSCAFISSQYLAI